MEEGLDLIGLWQAVVKRWYLVVLLPLIAAGSLFIYSFYNYTPVYTASATLMVMRPGSAELASSSDIYLSRALVSTYREIALSRRILRVVAEDQMIPYSIDQLRGKIEVAGVGGTELIEIKASDTDAVMASYMANMVSRIFMDEIGLVISDANVNILDEAPVPTGPSNPLADRNLIIAAMIGLIAAVGLVFVIDYVDQTIKEIDEAEKLLGLPVVGVLAQVDGKTREGKNEFTVSGRSPVAEAFRTIRTNIQFASVDKPVKVILVTGATPGSGKSTVAANLAITFAQGGGEVLLVDADLRRPTQQRFFEIGSETGLSSLVYNRELGLEDVAQDSGRDNLKVITSGPIPPYPAEMLSSKRMRELVKIMAGQFDYVIFDSPPVLAVTDAVVLSNLVDGTLIVLDYGIIRRDEALSTLKQLQMVQANVIGTVLNAVPQSQGGYGSYKNYYGLDEKKTGKRKKGKRLKAAGR